MPMSNYSPPLISTTVWWVNPIPVPVFRLYTNHLQAEIDPSAVSGRCDLFYRTFNHLSIVIEHISRSFWPITYIGVHTKITLPCSKNVHSNARRVYPKYPPKFGSFVLKGPYCWHLVTEFLWKRARTVFLYTFPVSNCISHDFSNTLKFFTFRDIDKIVSYSISMSTPDMLQ